MSGYRLPKSDDWGLPKPGGFTPRTQSPNTVLATGCALMMILIGIALVIVATGVTVTVIQRALP